VLEAARSSDCSVRGLRPLGVGSGPAYAVADARGRRWDLWFEGAGMWAHYGKPSPYVAATSMLPSASQPIGADLVLIRPGEHALVIECKYSPDAGYVTRNGYEQALAYQAEALAGLARTASAAVVGPDGVLPAAGEASTPLGPVTIMPAAALPGAVADALASP
jgi:hypothetical protein